MNMNVYEYRGEVWHFDECVECAWNAVTYAVSEKKARNNLTYRYKKEHNYSPNTRIVLPGIVKQIA